ncbi:uncharacterized protein I303_105780 [Kwoniella dejecticola CBS 10117]|uniref:Uncharacterized protein n=1 Tax=Kwoniella dejecticola CBS 10117 TaxID=1296121 RepID=A0A1A6A0C4_9TREE|nr:uncharacterized protein I303_05802 [Kwoniella dejecticola CBS 10117]OBR83522.1 hypothetical protein I303_05802 [Kwoniella dejecticola CBS 10117]
MYPYNPPPDPHIPPNHQQQRVINPHPLNQNFRFPPLATDTPQRSVSQPQPYPVHQVADHNNHTRRSSQLNPEASSFNIQFRPVEIASPTDGGFGRLKRYHDDPSALGVDYGDTGETFQRRTSPRKKALSRAMDFTPGHHPESSGFDHRYPTSLPRESNIPQTSMNRTQTIPSMNPTPTLHVQRDSQYYGPDRSILGIARPASISPQFNSPLTQNHTRNQSYATPPPLNRVWTLDSGSRSSLSPLTHAHQGLPLTLSPIAHAQGRVSPSQSVISAPWDTRSATSDQGRRVISLSPNLGRKREDSHFEAEKKYRGYRAKEGGPPKAVLGGPGGKTFDEMLALRSATTSPNVSPGKGGMMPSSPSRKASGISASSNATTDDKYMYKGKPIEVKLPPTTYSPPDTPPKPLPPSVETDEAVQDTSRIVPEERIPRKEGFPWPPSKIRFSPPGIPLPLSPEMPGEDTLRRPSIGPCQDMEDIQEGSWRGKQVLVSFPDQDCWEKLRPPTPPAQIDSEQDMTNEDSEETEAEVSGLLQADAETTAQDDDEETGSVSMVDDTIPKEAFKDDHMAWDEYPISPAQDVSLSAQADDKVSASMVDENGPAGNKLIPHPSLPPRPVTRDDAPPSCPPTLASNSTKRTFSGKELGNSDFLKRQLGPALRCPDTKEPDSASIHVRSTSVGSTGSWKRFDMHPTESAKDGFQDPDEICTEMCEVEGSPQGRSRMRGWSDDEEDEFSDAGSPIMRSAEAEAVSSPARLEQPIVDDIEMSITKHDIRQESESSPARPQSLEHPNEIIADSTQKDTPDESNPTMDNAQQSARLDKLSQRSHVVSKMRAWSHDEDIDMGSEEAIASPAILESQLLPDSMQATAVDGIKSANTVAEQYGVDTTYPGQPHSWATSPEPSKMRAWGLEDDDDKRPDYEAISAPARLPGHVHTVSASEEVDRWQNDRFDTAESEDVPLTATETNKAKPWDKQTELAVLQPVDEEPVPAEKKSKKRKDKRSREEDSETPLAESKMRAWLEDLPTYVHVPQELEKWKKNDEHDKSEEAETRMGATIPTRSAELDRLRNLALDSKRKKDSSMIKGKAQGDAAAQKALDDIKEAIAAMKARPSENEPAQSGGQEEMESVRVAKDGQAMQVDEVVEQEVQPSSPPAKRLRPTAGVFEPPRKPSYGALGMSKKPFKLSNGVPTLTPDAAPFVPHFTSFDFAVPRKQPLVNPNAPSFVPRSSSFTLVPPNHISSITSSQLPPGKTPHGIGPALLGPDFLPYTAPFAPLHTPDSDLNHEDGLINQGSIGRQLQPSSSPFNPQQTSSIQDGYAFAHPPASLNPRDRAASLTSNSSETRLRPMADTFVPPQRSVTSPTKAALKADAVPLMPPFSVASSDTVTSPIESVAVTRTSRDDIEDSTASTIIESSPVKSQSSPDKSTNAEPIDHRSPIKEDSPEFNEVEDLIRPPSSEEPILTPAEIQFEQHRPSSAESSLQVIAPGRGRADTVAFGPSTPIGTYSTLGDDMSNDPNRDAHAEDSAGDLDSLFSSTPVMTSSSKGNEGLGAREASPRLSVEGRTSRDSGASQRSARSRSRSSSTSDRLPRDDRPSAKREEENSYHPSDTPSLPLTDPIIPLSEITIHPSHPVQLPLKPRSSAEEPHDDYAFAHTATLSRNSAGSPDQSHTARPTLSRPLPPFPSQAPEPSDAQIFSSPAKVEEYTTPPQSTRDTLASAAYLTADGSPLIPTRTFDGTPPKRVRRPLPDIPTWRQPIPSITHISSTRRSSDTIEELDHPVQEGHEDDLVYPKVEIERKDKEFDRSAAPSPTSESASRIENVQNDVQPSPDPVSVNTKFREWIFPLTSDNEHSGHNGRPSIIRRHTMPPGDEMDDLESPPPTAESGMGIASTFAARVGEPRAYLRADEDISRRTSVEFPMREEKRTLGIVNVDDLHEGSLPSTSLPNENQRVGWDARLDEILELLRQNRDEDAEVKEAVVDSEQVLLAQPPRAASPIEAYRSLQSILEEHSRLLTSIHEIANLPQTPTPIQLITSDQTEQTQSQDLFAAILTGQHAILSKFDEIASSQLSGSETISQAVEALQYAQNAAEQRSFEEDTQRRTIMALREEIEDKAITISESRALADVLNQRLKDTRQDRDELRVAIQGVTDRLQEVSLKGSKLEDELDGVVARVLAAELERDALAKALTEGRDAEDRSRGEVREYQEQLDKERGDHQAALAEKESEIVDMQSTIHTQLSEIKEHREAINSLQNTIADNERDKLAEQEKRQLAQESTLAELSQNALSHQEELMARLNKLDENMYESMGSRVKEYESVLDRNRILQAEVDSLRERLEASAGRFAKLQLSTSNSLSANSVAQQALSDKLCDEIKRREEAEKEKEEMRKELEKTKEEKTNWRLVASERQAMARMQEIRLQALSQENVYWRQFALEGDGRRYKEYMGSKPFRNGDGSEMANTDQFNGTAEKKNEGTWYIEAS